MYVVPIEKIHLLYVYIRYNRNYVYIVFHNSIRLSD